jgi:hypothetical protein
MNWTIQNEARTLFQQNEPAQPVLIRDAHLTPGSSPGFVSRSPKSNTTNREGCLGF